MKVLINSNESIVNAIRAKIEENEGHCCCALPCDFSKDNLCMCKEFRDQIERREAGPCGCGLYEIVLEDDEKK